MRLPWFPTNVVRRVYPGEKSSMNPPEQGTNKDFWDFFAGAAVFYAVFVLIVGGLFTLMLLFGEPVVEA